MKLDILAFGAHPDDVELACSGTIAAHIRNNFKVGVVDLTRGELGTRGNALIRDQEAMEAAKLLGLSVRENLNMEDGFFSQDRHHLQAVVQTIRKYQPAIILCNAVRDRHPDHGRAAKLVVEASFLAGLIKYETGDAGKKQEAWKTSAVYHYIQDRYGKPDFVVDITEDWEKKLTSIRAYKSQFHNPDSAEPATAISSPEFLEFIEARAREMGREAGVTFAEGFNTARYPLVSSLFDLK